MVKPWALLALLLLVPACGPKATDYPLSIVTRSCDELGGPLDGVEVLRLQVTGEGIERPLVATGRVSVGHLSLPEIPAGFGRIIEVRGYDGDPTAGARVVSLGRTRPFDIPDAVPEVAPPPLTVFLRRVNAFSAPVAAAEGPCPAMKVARAGHSATLLRSGKVYLAGGFTLAAEKGARVALPDAELFDPASGVFEVARELSLVVNGITERQPRAYHSATLVPASGQVALWGGERYELATGASVPLPSLLFYDPDVDDYAALPSSAAAPLPRAHHGAAIDSGGRILVAGGIELGGRAQGAVEWIDPATTQQGVLEGLSLPRVDSAVATVRQGELVVVAGGTDGATMPSEVAAFQFTGGVFTQQAGQRLAGAGRRAAGWASVGAGADLILLGGYPEPSPSTPLASSELVHGDGGAGAPGPNVSAAAEVCAVTLPDGRIVVIGGRTVDELGVPRSVDQTLVLAGSVSGGLSSLGGPSLPRPRYGHTCTVLPDGTVLVTGGLDERGTTEALVDAWLYQPAPLD